MAVQTPPFVLQNSSHGSELVRREALASLTYGSAGGVVPATPTTSANLTSGVAGCSDLKVNAPASGMSCLVNAGQCYVPGSLGSGAGYGIGTGYGMPTVTLNGAAAPTVAATAKATAVQLTTQGMYYCYNDNSAGQVSLTVAASNGTNPRIDVVVAQVEDASYSGANNDWKLAVVTGTAAASPTVPALPANALVLAYLWIPAASTSVTAGNILDLRVACNRNPYRARGYRNAAFALTSGATTAIPLDTVSWDLTGALTTVYTCPVSGLYAVSFQGTISTTAAGQNMNPQLLKNGSEVASGTSQTPPGAGAFGCSGSDFVLCQTGDTLGLAAFVSAALNTTSAGAASNYLSVSLVAPL